MISNVFSFIISVLTNRPGYSIEGNIQCYIVQSYSTTDGYVQSCRKFCQTPVPVGRVSDCMKFCQAPVLIGVPVTFRMFLLKFNPVNEEIIKPILKRAKPDRGTKHYVLVLLLYKNLILF